MSLGKVKLMKFYLSQLFWVLYENFVKPIQF